jgi:hypothetical protein
MEFYRTLDSHELGHSELSDKELGQLEALLRNLNGPVLSR